MLRNLTVANVYDSRTDSTQPRYYFWVKDITSVPAEAEFRTISADAVRSLIQDPKAAGLPHVAFLDTDAVALYNCKQYFADRDTVLSINYDVVKNEGVYCTASLNYMAEAILIRQSQQECIQNLLTV